MSTLSVSLTPELTTLIDQKMSSGIYHSASEVVLAGLRLLNKQDETILRQLKEEIAIGSNQLERGESKVFYSGEELADHIESEGRKLLANRVTSK